MKCPEQLLFDRYFGDCNYAHLVICEPKNAICEQFRALDWLGAIKIGNPLDCSSFYYCISGRAIETICPTGLFFNPYTANCEVKDTVNFCQGVGPIITTPLPEFTTREYTTAPTTTKTTVRVIKITNPTATTTVSTTTTQETTTGVSTTTTSTTTTATTGSSSATDTTSDTIETTTTSDVITEGPPSEEPITEETTIEPEPEPTEPDGIVYPYCPPNITAYYPMPYPENCTRYYYCSRGIQRFAPYTCAAGLFFTPGNDRCTADVPPGCEHLVE